MTLLIALLLESHMGVLGFWTGLGTTLLWVAHIIAHNQE